MCGWLPPLASSSRSSDFSRRTPVVDPDDHHLFVSLGCATETLLQAGLGYGWAGEPEMRMAG